MKTYVILIFIFLLSGCEYPHASLQGEVLNGYFVAIEQHFINSGQTISLKGQEQYLRTKSDTLRVFRNDSTLLFLPDYRKNYELGDKQNGIIVLEAETPTGLKSIRMVLGENYRKHPEGSPLTLGQLIDGKYDANLDTVRTVYEYVKGAWPKE